MSRTLRNLGVAYRDSGDLVQAEKLLQQSISQTPRGCLLELAQSFNSLATLYRKLGDSERAIEQYQKSLSFLAKLGDTFRPAQVYNNLGLTYLDQRCWDTSLCFFRKSLKIKRTAGDTAGQATTLNNLMQVYRNLGRDKEAIETAQHAGKLFEELQDYHASALVNRNLGRAYRRAKEKDEANEYYYRALELLAKSIEQQGIENRLGLKFETESIAFGNKRIRTQENQLHNEMEAIKEEIESLNRRFWLPWWMWLSIIALLLLLVWLFAPLVPSIFRHPSLS